MGGGGGMIAQENEKIGRIIDGRKLFKKEKIYKGRKLPGTSRKSVEEMNFCRGINSLNRGKCNIHLLKISINLHFFSMSHI